MPVERAHQRALPALRPQVGVHLEAGLARDPHHAARPAAAGGGVGGLGHEHDVDVADVVQLVPAALAHRDHGQPPAPSGGAHLGHRDRERRRAAPLRPGRPAGRRRRRPPAPAAPARRPRRGRPRPARAARRGRRCAGRRPLRPRSGGPPRRRRRRPAGHRGRRRPRQQSHRRVRPCTGPVAQPVPAVGVGDQVVAQRRGAAEERGSRPRRPTSVAAPCSTPPCRPRLRTSRSSVRSARSGSGLRASAHIIASAPRPAGRPTTIRGSASVPSAQAR